MIVLCTSHISVSLSKAVDVIVVEYSWDCATLCLIVRPSVPLVEWKQIIIAILLIRSAAKCQRGRQFVSRYVQTIEAELQDSQVSRQNIECYQDSSRNRLVLFS